MGNKFGAVKNPHDGISIADINSQKHGGNIEQMDLAVNS